MPRKLIKERAFQEPIHEDAPGFNPNMGHRNLITELNEEVLPSYATDIIGTPESTSELYQLRVNATGQLEYFAAGEWKTVQVAGGTVNTGYNPQYKALVSVNAPFASDCFVYVDIETGLSSSGRDFAGYQFGVRRPTHTYVVGPGSTAGKVIYRVLFEASLQPGMNELEVRYGNVGSELDATIAWSLLGEYDLLQLPMSHTDLYAFILPRETPNYVPMVRSWAEAATFGDSVLVNGAQTWNFPQQIYNINKAAWVTPQITATYLDLGGDNTHSASGAVQRPNCLNLRCNTNSDYGYTYTFLSYVRQKSLPHGNLYGIRSSYRQWSNNDTTDGFYILGLLNNGWILFGEYKHPYLNWGGDTSQVNLTYGTSKNNAAIEITESRGQRLNWTDAAKIRGGLPDLRMMVPAFTAQVIRADEVVE